MNDELPSLPAPSARALRAKLHDLVLADLLGPFHAPDEEIDDNRVSDRYLVGMLAPRKQREGIPPETQDDLALSGGDDDNGRAEQDSSFADSLFPSSFGMTFCIERSARKIQVDACWGWYRRQLSEGDFSTRTGLPKRIWRRHAVAARRVLELTEGQLAPISLSAEQPEVVVQGIARIAGGHWIVSLFLVNNQSEPDESRDEAWLFQPELAVSDPAGASVFLRREVPRDWAKWDALTREEMRTNGMLYRRQQEFAVGHGVGVTWKVNQGDPKLALEVRTRVVPEYEVPQVAAPSSAEMPELEGLTLDMKVLAETEKGGFRSRLETLITAYASWIAKRDSEVAGSDHEDAGRLSMMRCRRTLERIEEGITLLDLDEQAADAFRFANRSMWLQRSHSIHAGAVRRGSVEEPARQEHLQRTLDEPTNRTWRPFQLAFILLNLSGLTDLSHIDRSDSTKATADLLWFPTGGGKTEAYLGLAAYAMVIRRLQGVVAGRDGSAGVAVLMRYTLRLLTLQQFQRAAALLCACEEIRREALMQGDLKWGKEPFRLGLYVGNKTTPGTVAAAAESIRADLGGGKRPGVGLGSVGQLTNCPWCGCKIDKGRHLKALTDRLRVITYCGDDNGMCLFSERQSPGEGLPVIVVDDEMYRRLPSMVIATVDKFAQMPWNGAIQTLFGQVERHCPRHGYYGPSIKDEASHRATRDLPAVQSAQVRPLRPPDLIIQDELHLISGPLGTLVGLYETAVDELSTWEVDGKRIRPKVVASTATIKRAQDQIHALFTRRAEVFPPSGLEVGDNFFALQRAVDDDHAGRLYLGICAPGKRLKATLIRVYTAYLAAAQKVYKDHGGSVDPWMTLVGYFNSLRELGGMRRLVDDDVRTRLLDMDNRGLASRRPPAIEELTSRMNSTDIPRILDRMEIPFDPAMDEARREKKKVDMPRPIDVLLSSNMISVGVDVQRLGLMVVAGQPKTTAEYIQATSRVGRSKPGLVCTVFNWARPRDLSHYEMFEHYHATFYQHVEALSVTPFASRALDRGLSALLVALLRLSQFELNENRQAQSMDRTKAYVARALDRIKHRAELVTAKTEVGEAVLQQLKERLDFWQMRAARRDEGADLGYEDERGRIVGLLEEPGIGNWELFTCLNSLRDVEPSVALILSDRAIE